MGQLDGKIAIITGGGTGIGKGIARAFAREGATLVIASRNRANLEATATELRKLGGEVLVVTADVGDEQQVAALFEQTMGRFAKLDILVNNSGIFERGAIDGLSLEAWQRVVDVNLTGPFICTREAMRIMKRQQGGRIINIGSISAQMPRFNSAPYTATKHGVTGLTKATSLDGRKYDIACGQIDIGNAATDMTARMTDGTQQADGSVKVEPRFDLEHVAETVLYMANLPLETNVQFITIMATKMPYIGRG